MATLGIFQKIHALIEQNPNGIKREKIIEKLGLSKSAGYRLIRQLRDEFGAPIVRARKLGHIKYQEGVKYEIPGLWLTDGEIGALLGITMWVTGPEASILSDIMQPLKKRLTEISKILKIDPEQLESVAVLQMNSHTLNTGVLRAICQSLLEKKRLVIKHGEAGQEKDREISPLKLVRYRDNWYLDAYCHLREELRCFSVFRVSSAKVSKEKARKVPAPELKEHFTTSYGIFGGRPKHMAVLKFTGFAAKYVATERWHPKQEKEWTGDDLILKFPYNIEHELVLDIMHWGPEVEVLEPKILRDEVASRLRKAVSLYSQ